ncbi:MAG TPA: radical SAM protein [Candidatus Aenigmarchaeota archaeon]|nr:radical SAM protein [Candidatus Aenigmarchaeota archaeon]
MVKKVFPRYVKIANNEAVANFQICKKVPFEFTRSMSSEELWEAHKKLMKDFRKLKRKLDTNKLKFEEVKTPRYSLLDLKIMLVEEILKSCELCERRCKVNRLKGELGECKVGKVCLISSDFMHLGEEFFIVPSHTIFFMGCDLHCIFCQNWTISQWFESGHPVTPATLAKRIDAMKKRGCRNVNLVGGEPTPNLYWILRTLKLVKVNQAVVWNSNFYMSDKTMEILDGTVDVYLSDFKYGNDECALHLSKVPNYFEVVSRNHRIAVKQAELLVRHLVLPNHLECCTIPVFDWIAKYIKKKCVVNVMDQYRPEFKAMEYKDINRRLTKEEFERAVKYAEKKKLNFIT